MAISNFLKLAVVALLGTSVVAHPRLSKEEMAEYQDLVARHTEALGRCLESRELREINARMFEERGHEIHKLRTARGLDKRGKEDVKYWAGQNHKHDGQSPDPQDLWQFRWDQKDPYKNVAGCALAPESIYGPFWLDGQLQRQDIRAGSKGINLRLAMQVIDVATCKPVHNARVDAWQADAVGNYNTINTGPLRGWQPSSVFGTVDFDTIFPGHYPGRATHIHVAVRPENSKIVHAGQLYFDDALREKVEATEEYKKNKHPIVGNLEDGFAPSAASKQYDPFVQWSYLGNDVNDGVLAWIAMGVNLTANVRQPGKRSLNVLDDHLDHSLHGGADQADCIVP